MPSHVVRALGSAIGLSGACAAGFAWLIVTVAQPAAAVTLTNRDDKTYAVEVSANSARRAHQLAPGKSIAGVCKDGCILRLIGIADGEYVLEGTERVSIEGGLVYYDGQEVKPNGRAKP